jgi:YggT family protein
VSAVIVLALTRNDVANYVQALFRVYTLIIIAYIVASLFFAFGGRVPYSRWSRAVLDFLRDVSEPLLRPFRAILPNFGPLDLSPMIAIIVLNIVGALVVNLVRG